MSLKNSSPVLKIFLFLEDDPSDATGKSLASEGAVCGRQMYFGSCSAMVCLHVG